MLKEPVVRTLDPPIRKVDFEDMKEITEVISILNVLSVADENETFLSKESFEYLRMKVLQIIEDVYDKN